MKKLYAAEGCNRVFSYKEAKLINEIRSLGELEFEEYKEEGIYIGAWIGADIYSKIITKY